MSAADKTVFISYADEDAKFAVRLYQDLKNAGKSCTAEEIIEYYERRMEEIRKQVSR